MQHGSFHIEFFGSDQMVRESTRKKVRESIEPNRVNTLQEIVERSGFTEETVRRALFQLCMDDAIRFVDQRQTGGPLGFWIPS